MNTELKREFKGEKLSSIFLYIDIDVETSKSVSN